MSQPSQPYSNHGMTIASGGSQETSSLSQQSENDPRSESERENEQIRRKQQRLLLLRHASRCQHEAGKCPVTPHCASMKRLWEHITHCKYRSCTVQHCLSSRYVLSITAGAKMHSAHRVVLYVKQFERLHIAIRRMALLRRKATAIHSIARPISVSNHPLHFLCTTTSSSGPAFGARPLPPKRADCPICIC